jgi:hypothetical protein
MATAEQRAMKRLLVSVGLCVSMVWPASSSAQWLGTPDEPARSSGDMLVLQASAAFAVGDQRAARRALREARRASDDERVLVAEVALRGGGDPGLVLTLSDEILAALVGERAGIDGQQSLAIGLGIAGAGLGIGAGFFALAGVFDNGCGLLASSCVPDPNESWFVGAAISGVVGISLAIASIALLADGASRAGRWHRAYRAGMAPGDLNVVVSASPEGGTVVVRGALP